MVAIWFLPYFNDSEALRLAISQMTDSIVGLKQERVWFRYIISAVMGALAHCHIDRKGKPRKLASVPSN